MAEPKVPTKVRFYRFKNRLRERTAGLGNKDVAISSEALARAESALTAMSEDYPDWVMNLVNKLADHHRRSVDTPEMRKDLFVEISRIAHDMKGQGGTFGYPLISIFAESLYDTTAARDSFKDDNSVEIVKAHVDAMRAVIRGRVAGDGGDIGKELTEALQNSIAKYKA